MKTFAGTGGGGLNLFRDTGNWVTGVPVTKVLNWAHIRTGATEIYQFSKKCYKPTDKQTDTHTHSFM